MADDEPSVLINYERESIHAGDDPIPLTIEFPARVTITDLLVTFAERQSRFFAYRRGKSTWQIWHIPDNEEARRVIGLVQFDNVPDDAEHTLVFAIWGDPYWGRSLITELSHQSELPVRIRATSTHGGPVATLHRWNSYTAAAPPSVAERPSGSA